MRLFVCSHKQPLDTKSIQKVASSETLNSSPSFLSNLAFHFVFFTLQKLNDLYVFKLKNTLNKYNTFKKNQKNFIDAMSEHLNEKHF